MSHRLVHSMGSGVMRIRPMHAHIHCMQGCIVRCVMYHAVVVLLMLVCNTSGVHGSDGARIYHLMVMLFLLLLLRVNVMNIKHASRQQLNSTDICWVSSEHTVGICSTRVR